MSVITISRQVAALGDEIASDAAKELGYTFVTSHDIEKYRVIMPLRFSDWEEHKAEYLAMVASDVEFLERNPL